MPVTTYSDVARSVSDYYDRNFLENARPYTVYRQFGQVKRLPDKSSKTIRFRRVNTLPAVTTPLTEGITPAGNSFSISEISATVNQYGDYVTFSDEVALTAEDPILTKISSEQGEQAGITLDNLARDVLVAGTNITYSNGTARAQVNTELTLGNLETSVRFLRGQNAKPIKERITPGPGYGTEGIQPAFFGIIHQDMIPTIEAMAGFISVKNYPDSKAIMENEIGAVGSIRFVWTTEATIWAGAGAIGGSNVKETSTNADVYATMILARDAFGVVMLESGSMQNIVKAVGSAGSTDPLNQTGSMGWKLWDAVKILNEGFIIRIESAARDNL